MQPCSITSRPTCHGRRGLYAWTSYPKRRNPPRRNVISHSELNTPEIKPLLAIWSVRTESVRTRIEVLRDIVIAARALPAGTVLTDSDVRTIQKWVRRIHPQSLTSLDTTSGKRLTIQIASGTEILATMLKDTPLVRKGKMVRMVFDNGLVHIVTVGLSEEDGIAGNIVRVKNITSNKIIYARVLSDSLVGIEF